MNDSLVTFIVVLGMFVGISILLIGMRAIDIKYINNVPIKITMGGTEIYSGINGCVKIISGGDTTQVKIKGGFLCLFPQAEYTGKDIIVRGIK